MLKKLTQIIMLVACFGFGVSAQAMLMTYSDRASFEATLDTIITDDYSAAGYTAGDIVNTPTFDIHSDSNMSSILGETDYTTTGHLNTNLIIRQATDPRYCAGCNGSFNLGFTTTSVGDASGVYGVGFDIFQSSGYDAFATFSDGSTMNFDLGTGDSFFGLTQDIGITSIHLGLANGGTTTDGYLEMDNLTIGNAVPEPATLALFGLGLAGLGFARKKKKS